MFPLKLWSHFQILINPVPPLPPSLFKYIMVPSFNIPTIETNKNLGPPLQKSFNTLSS